MSRTVRPDGDKIARLRQRNGWSVEETARRLGLSLRTVQNVERGNPVFVFTLRKFADMFAVEYQQLLAELEPAPVSIPQIRLNISITINRPAHDFDESRELISWLEELANRMQRYAEPSHEMRENTVFEVQDVIYESVTIKVEMSAKDITLILYLYATGKLDGLGIEKITAPENVRLPRFDANGQLIPAERPRWHKG